MTAFWLMDEFRRVMCAYESATRQDVRFQQHKVTSMRTMRQ